MKASELIELLKQCDEDQEVKIWSEFGDLDIERVEKTDEGIVLS